jgi:hypothetical protein
MTSTVERLLELGGNPSESARLAILKDCVEGFNALDAELHCIHTEEREDICEEFEAIVCACGMGDHSDLVDSWREW